MTWVPTFGEFTLCVNPVGASPVPERATAGSVHPVPGKDPQHHRAPASRSGHDLPNDLSEDFDLTSGPRVEMKSGTDGPFPSHSHRAGSLPGPCGWSREERAGAEAAGPSYSSKGC